MDDVISINLKILQDLQNEIKLLLQKYSQSNDNNNDQEFKSIPDKLNECNNVIKELELECRINVNDNQKKKSVLDTISSNKQIITNLKNEYESIKRSHDKSSLLGATDKTVFKMNDTEAK